MTDEMEKYAEAPGVSLKEARRRVRNQWKVLLERVPRMALRFSSNQRTVNKRIKPVEHPDDGLLEDALMAASTDWEEGFVDDLLKRRERWMSKFTLSDAQRAKLEQIRDGDGR